jgi:biotin carboxylase
MGYLWIIGGGLMQVPVIEEVKKMGYMTIVSDADKDCVCASKADIFLNVDIFDVDGHIKASEGMEDSLMGVFACGIDAPVTASTLAKRFGLPGAHLDMAQIIHDKHMFRISQKALGYLHPDFEYIPKNKDYPVNKVEKDLVVKPSLNSGSRGTTLIKKGAYPLDVQRAVEYAHENSRDGGCLVEERLFGTEHTVETLIDKNGEFHPCFITDRIFDYTNGAVETGLRNPSILPMYLQRKALEIAKNMAYDYMIDNSPLKLDIIVTERGIYVLEATTRMSGGFDCQYLVPAATGMNPIKAGLQVCLGMDVDKRLLSPTKDKVAVSNSLWPPVGRIKSVNGMTEAKKIHGVEKIFMRYKAGDVIEPYINCARRVCFVITSGHTYGEAMGVFEEVKNTLKIEVDE